jgi:hypothetical protein
MINIDALCQGLVPGELNMIYGYTKPIKFTQGMDRKIGQRYRNQNGVIFELQEILDNGLLYKLCRVPYITTEDGYTVEKSIFSMPGFEYLEGQDKPEPYNQCLYKDGCLYA